MHQLTLAEIARALADKQFSSAELTGSLLRRIEQLDRHPGRADQLWLEDSHRVQGAL